MAGVLRAPFSSRFAKRVGETAVPARTGGVGWIERALMDGGDPDADRMAGLVGTLSRLRIGGEFWAPAPNWPRTVELVVKVDRRGEIDDALACVIGQTSMDRVGLLLPSAAWSTAMSRRLRRLGLAFHIGAADPWAVLDQASVVHVGGDDDLGLLGLMAGRAVHCRSAGFLTGWGLTTDAPSIARRGRRNLHQLAAAALVDGVRYYDPFNGRVARCEAIVDHLANWRRVVDEDRDLACLAGVAWWKRRRLRGFFAPGARRAPFIDDAKGCVAAAARRGGAIGVWPSGAPTDLAALARAAKAPLRRIEDGFVRSVGLGSDLLPPCSIVVDRRGIYYDPGRPSDLEAILAETDVSPEMRRRAAALTESLLANRLTKYNTGGAGYARPASARVVLVPGQVEDDQSLINGGGDCKGNLDLLRRVREREPSAFIVYKPHPDVEAGNRVGKIADDEALKFADSIERKAAMPALLDAVDAVHVLTSLAGFEALLREREVVVHGRPFYSGWGLTTDLDPPPRRGRRLALADLVAGTLILYPRYLDPVTGLLCSPEVLIERLAQLRAGPGRMTLVLRALRRRFEGGVSRAGQGHGGGRSGNGRRLVSHTAPEAAR